MSDTDRLAALLAGPWDEKRSQWSDGQWSVHGPCWGCGQAIWYRVDEDGTPRDIEPDAPRLIAAGVTCALGPGPLLVATLPAYIPAPLDAAWAEAEASLPKHWRLAISPYYPHGWEAYAYDIRKVPDSGMSEHGSGACYGDTPAAALLALAATMVARAALEGSTP